MAFKIITDTGSNLPKSTLTQMDVTVIPFTYWMQGVPQECPVYPEDFDSHAYYDKLRAGAEVKTSLINSDKFASYFRPAAGSLGLPDQPIPLMEPPETGAP